MNTKQHIITAALIATAFTACKKDDDVTPDTDKPVVEESVSGDISGTWTKGSTYKITGSVQVPEGKSLIIEEGVTVLFNDSIAKPEFLVKGNLYSQGTAANPVMFTVPDEWKAANEWGALWGGLICGAGCTEFLLDHTVLEYGGAVTTEESASVKAGLYKAEAGEHVPAIYYPTVGGKFVVVNSTIRHFNEDGMYIEGGSVIVASNKIYTQGVSGGDAINIKSGVVADVAFNLIYSPNTNALKLSNSGDRTPQAYVKGYNNTIINAGWRRPTVKGGSIWVEKTVRAELCNNLLINDRFGIKRDAGDPEDNRSIISNNYYYGYDQTTVDQFQPSDEIVAGVNDVISTTAGANDPKLVNYPLSTTTANYSFSTSWDFHLQSGSPALGKGITSFTRNHASGLSLNGTSYAAPAPQAYAGAYGTN